MKEIEKNLWMESPIDPESLLIKHEELHQKYRRYFLMMIALILVVVFFNLMIGIVRVSGGDTVIPAVIFAIVVLIAEILLLMSIINIAFEKSFCFSFTKPNLVWRARPEGGDEAFLMSDI